MPALKEAYPELEGRKGIEVFRRKWIYYYVYCETGFAMRALGGESSALVLPLRRVLTILPRQTIFLPSRGRATSVSTRAVRQSQVLVV